MLLYYTQRLTITDQVVLNNKTPDKAARYMRGLSLFRYNGRGARFRFRYVLPVAASFMLHLTLDDRLLPSASLLVPDGRPSHDSRGGGNLLGTEVGIESSLPFWKAGGIETSHAYVAPLHCQL